jgi:hypothetical protein
MRRSCRLVALWALTAGCTGAPAPPSAPAQYLFAWAYDLDERAGDSNFVAVIDADRASPGYGRVVATMPSSAAGGMPHHTEQLMPPGGLPLVANAFHADRSVLPAHGWCGWWTPSGAPRGSTGPTGPSRCSAGTPR